MWSQRRSPCENGESSLANEPDRRRSSAHHSDVVPIPEHPLDDADLLCVGDLHLDSDRRFDRRFRRHDISGWAKAAWVIFVVIIPWIGVLVYLIANHDGMTERRM